MKRWGHHTSSYFRKIYSAFSKLRQQLMEALPSHGWPYEVLQSFCDAKAEALIYGRGSSCEIPVPIRGSRFDLSDRLWESYVDILLGVSHPSLSPLVRSDELEIQTGP